MFATAGFFRGILCPENESGEDNKKCRRPYCHFRHVRQVPSVENAPEGKKAGEKKSLSRSTVASSSLPSFRKHKDRTPASKPIAYVPTPLSLCKKPPPESFQDDPSIIPDTTEPEAIPEQSSMYTPTPLAELEAREVEELSIDETSYDAAPVEGTSSSYHLDSLEDDSSQGDVQSSTDGYLDQDRHRENQHEVCSSAQARQAETVQNNLQKSLSQDYQGRSQTQSSNLQDSFPSEEDEEVKDVIIQTHTYGGITVTTRTPRNLCTSGSDADSGDAEYDPFEADVGQSTDAYQKESQHVSRTMDDFQLHGSNYSQHSSFSEDFPTEVTSDVFRNDNLEGADLTDELLDSRGTNIPSSAALLGQEPLYGMPASEFEGYSQSASYSYSENGNRKTDTKYDVEEPPLYSKSESAIRVNTKKAEKKKDPNALFKKNFLEKRMKDKVIENGNKVKADGKSSELKKDNKNISKKVVQRVDSVNSTDKKKVSVVKKKIKKEGGTSKTSTQSEAKKKVVEHATDKKKAVQKDKKKTIVSGEKSTVKQKISKDTDDQSVNRTDNLKTKPGDVARTNHDANVSCEKEKPEETVKRKVSSEQLSDFFKKRREQKTNKGLGKVKVGAVNGDKNRGSKSDPLESNKPSSKDNVSKSKEKVWSNKLQKNVQDPKSTNKSEKHRFQETKSKDRSLFDSMKKPSSKVAPKRPSVKECGIDLFAIANDSSSEAESEEDGYVAETSSKPRQRHPSISNLPSTDSKQSAKDGSGRVKRAGSTSDHPDSKRLRKTSSSLPRQDNTKMVELDLFGDDSDGDSDVIMLLDEDVDEVPMKIAKKSVSTSASTSKVNSNVSKSSIGSVSASSKHTSSKTVASRGLPGAEKQSNFISTKIVSPKKHSTVGKPKPLPIPDNQGTKRKTSIQSKGSNKGANQHNDHNHKVSKSKPDKKYVADISSSDDGDYDNDDLPSGLHSINKKDHVRVDASDEEDIGISRSRVNPGEYMDDMKKFLEDSSSEEEDTFDECYRIFQEDHGEEKPSTSHRQRNPGKEMPNKETSATSAGKQRLAHASKFGKQRHKSAPKKTVNSIPSAAQMCHNRYLQIQQMQERGGSQEGEEGGPEPSSGTSITGKRRVAHQGGTNATLKKLTLGSSPSKGTTAMTNAKMGRRLAHTPKTVTKRPVIPADFGSKVPMNIRQRYLNVFIDELLKTATTEQDAFDKALAEEKIVYQRASSKNIYLNLCVNALKKLQNSSAAILKSPPTTPTKSSNRMISHEAMLGGKLAAKTSYSIHKPVHAAETENFEGVFLYEKFQPFILTEEQLRENGFPRPSDIPGQAAIFKEERNKTVASSDPNLQVCSRCGTTFLRDPDGEYITRDACTYHWGRPWTRRIAGAIESRFSCCSGDMEAKGCCVARLHVTDKKTANLNGFMKTISKPPSKAGHPGMYAMDCEMCYTTMGLELTRVTVINDKLEEVYDTLVKPDNEVIDYNTRFSGITEEDLRHVNTRLRDVQAVLLNMFSKDAILMGHSLESDLLALKMIHGTVIDTSVVFPHRRGPPFKRALKTLMAEFLKRLIQDDIGGHDSTEDARSCMELMIWKVKEVAKVKRKR